MESIPFGIRRLDNTIGGGAPPGSVVLLAGEAGAGAREFVQTAAVMNGVAHTDDDLFDLHYGTRAPEVSLPEEIHYLSFTDAPAQFAQEVERSMDSDLAGAGLERVIFESLAEEYFHDSVVPSQWYTEGDDDNLPARDGRHQDLLRMFRDVLAERAPGNLLVVDSLSDLVEAAGDSFSRRDIVAIVKGIRRAAHDWGGLVLLHVNRNTVDDETFAQLVDSVTATLRFRWASGGSVLARTLVMKSFRGILSQVPEDDIVEFETELGDSGFTISDVRKIR